MSEEGAAALTAVEPAGGDNGASAGSWLDGMSEDSRAFAENKGWDTPDSALESYRNLEKFAGGNKNLVELPGVDADDEVMANFYDRLGRPEAPDKYGLDVPDGADGELVDWFRSTAHKYGLSEKQAKSIFGEWNEMSTSRLEAMQTQSAEAAEADINALKKEWGQAYDSQIDAGKQAVAALGFDEAKLGEYEEKLGTGEMLRLFAQLGSKMGEDNFVDGGRSDSGFGVTPAAARAELADLKLDQGFMDKYLAGDKDAVAKYTRLMNKAYG